MRKNGWYVIGMSVTLLAGAWWTPHLFHETSCLFVRVLPAKSPGPDKLLECSNIEQSVTIPSDGKLRDTEADVQGWRMFSSTGGSGRLRIRFNKRAGTYVFYPRLSGESGSISIYEVMGDHRRLLYFERGTANGWTPVARRMLFRADCVANGWSDEEFPVELEILLEGPHAQLWHKNKVIFF
jgi:hypothetical protein